MVDPITRDVPERTRSRSTAVPITRRCFVSSAAAFLSAPFIAPAAALGRGEAASPSERITLGFIGVGGRGMSHVRSLLAVADTQIVAVCDPFRAKRDAAKKSVENHYARAADTGSFRGCLAASDFREVLAREDIDAVVVASPEHWHALHMASAAKAGKDVYGEKALSLTIHEGRLLCDTVRRYRRVFQVGTQQRSGRNFRFACELARNGYLGKLKRVEVGVPGGYALPNARSEPVPDGLDYDLWLGPAPTKPYNRVRCASPNGWYHVYDYCVGWIQSWGVHHCDIAVWGAPALATQPLEVEATATFPKKGMGNTPVSWRSSLTTPDGLCLSFSDNRHHGQGCRFIGETGWVHVNRGSIRAEPKSLLDVILGANEEHLYDSRNHHLDFLDCVRSRRDPVAPVEAGHAATTIPSVVDVAIRLGRKVTWNWENERFVNDDIANRFLRRPMRGPWTL